MEYRKPRTLPFTVWTFDYNGKVYRTKSSSNGLDYWLDNSYAVGESYKTEKIATDARNAYFIAESERTMKKLNKLIKIMDTFL